MWLQQRREPPDRSREQNGASRDDSLSFMMTCDEICEYTIYDIRLEYLITSLLCTSWEACPAHADEAGRSLIDWRGRPAMVRQPTASPSLNPVQ